MTDKANNVDYVGTIVPVGYITQQKNNQFFFNKYTNIKVPKNFVL